MRTYLTNACNQRSVFLNIQLVMIEPLEEATMQPVTIAKMISLDDPTPVMLPKNFVDETVGEAKSAALRSITASMKVILTSVSYPSPRPN